MSTLGKLEQAVRALSPGEMARFRAWFAEFDWAAWERQIEQDAAAGKLDSLAETALREHASGRTRPL